MSGPALSVVPQYESISTRQDVTLSIWVEKPEKIQAVVILFAGGKGNLDIDEDGIGRDGNFLIRSRHHFINQGMAVVIPDVPSDKDSLLFFRTSPEYITDMGYTLAWVQREFKDIPVFLAGTSRGTISVTSIASNLEMKKYFVQGIILSATVTQESNSGKQDVYSNDIERIKTPTLLSHHEFDECYITPLEGALPLLESLINVKDKSLITYKTGVNKGNPCRGKSYHGFNGIEEQVVSDMVFWIKRISASQ